MTERFSYISISDFASRLLPSIAGLWDDGVPEMGLRRPPFGLATSVVLLAALGCSSSPSKGEPNGAFGSSDMTGSPDAVFVDGDGSIGLTDSDMTSTDVPPTLDVNRTIVSVDRAAGVVADGVDHAKVTVTLRDAQDHPFVGHAVSVTASGTQDTIGPGGISDSSGVVQVSFASTRAELKTISAFVDGSSTALPQHPTVQFVAGPASAENSRLTAMPSSAPTDGSSTVTLIASVFDAHGNPVSGMALAIAASGSGNVFVPSPANGLTDSAGQFDATLASSTAETKQVTATVESLPLTANVTFLSMAPEVSGISATGSGSCVTLTYSLRQIESKRSSVVIEYDPSGSGTFFRATQAASSTVDGSYRLTSSPAGQAHSFLWNTSDDLRYQTRPNLVVRIMPYLDSQPGVPAQAAVPINNGLSLAARATDNLGVAYNVLAPADIDRDGKLDLLLAGPGNNGQGELYLVLGNGDGTFAALPPVATTIAQQNPSAIAVADMNRDGKLDAVTASNQGNTVSISIGNGDGTFAGGNNYAISQPNALVANDFNNDGRVDVVTANQGGTVTMLLGNGDGTLQSATDYSLNGAAQSIASADMNRDGKLDLVIGSASNSTVSVLLGDGKGGFAAAQPFAAGSPMLDVAIGDVNRDGSPDVLATSMYSDAVNVLLGRGDGTLRVANPIQLVPLSEVRTGRLADLDGDGNVDIVALLYSDRSLEVALGNGDGSFRPPVALSIGQLAAQMFVLADLNLDAKLDLVVADGGSVDVFQNIQALRCEPRFAAVPQNSYTSGAIAAVDINGDGKLDLVGGGINFGDGDGGFTPMAGAPQASIFAVADFNVDGNADLLGTTGAQCAASLYEGHGDGTFSVVAAPNVCRASVADFNHDTKPDLLTYDSGDNTNTIILGNGDGTFATPIGISHPTQLATYGVGDFTGDGIVDLLLSDGSANVEVLPGVGDGTFSTAVPTQGVGPGSQFPAVLGDFNSDGRLDFVVVGGGFPPVYVGIIFGNGDGTFHSGPTTCSANPTDSLIAADVNHDGHLDIVTTTTLCLGNGDGTFIGSSIIGLTGAMVAADFNNDGLTDIGFGGTTNIGANTVANIGALLGNGNGTFQQAAVTPVGTGGGSPGTVVSADFDGDGIADIAFTDANNNRVGVLLGTGNGTLEPMHFYSTGTRPIGLTTADFNHDGNADLLATDQGSTDIAVFLGDGTGAFSAAKTSALAWTTSPVELADFNRDGQIDVAGAGLILLGKGDGTFTQAGTYGDGVNPDPSLAACAGDVNVDGKPDLVVYDSQGTQMRMLFGTGDGTFTSGGVLPLVGAPLAIVDINHDGKPDLLGSGFVRLGNGDGTFQQTTNRIGAAPFRVVDFDGDGNLDVMDQVNISFGNGDGTFGRTQKYIGSTSGAAPGIADLNRDGLLDSAISCSYGWSVPALCVLIAR